MSQVGPPGATGTFLMVVVVMTLGGLVTPGKPFLNALWNSSSPLYASSGGYLLLVYIYKGPYSEFPVFLLPYLLSPVIAAM